MSYQDVLNYLYAPQRIQGQNSIKAGQRGTTDAPERTLEPMRQALAAMGNPHLRFKSVHIAGSKGKGSVSAMLASVLDTAGYRVGLFTSPHLHSYRERMQINRALPSEADIVELFEARRALFDAMSELITFELTTLMAFDYFAREGVEIAVIEVGLGGRLDSTNVVLPEVSVIAALSLEHTAILGDTIEKIAFEKAGIIKPGVPAILAPNVPAATAVVAEIARERGAPLLRVGEDIPYRLGDAYPRGQSFEVRRWPSGPWQRETIPLLGEHQAVNAACAIGAVDVLISRGIPVSDQALTRGLADVRWPARLEVLGETPLVVVDGAHTPDSAAYAVAALRRHLTFDRLILVFGALSDKDVGGMLDALLPASSAVVMTRSRYPRALAGDDLAQMAEARGVTPAAVTDDVPEGLAAALGIARPQDLVLVTGSLFVAAAAREAWLHWRKLPLPDLDPPLHGD
ncbi:MAG: folylpolyglutamate synthase/dihydrofolate synthase family protein [Anaerolineae bacterium]